MIVAVNQPTYLPWLGYFQLIAEADQFVLLDTAQYVHQEWNNRNRLKSGDGKAFWLTVPVHRGQLDTPINEIRIASDGPNRKWQKKHVGTIVNLLSKAPFFQQLWPEIEQLILTPYEKLSDLNTSIILHVTKLLDLNAEIYKASELSLPGRRTELLKNICLHFGADTYYSPAGAAVYLAEEQALLTEAGISVRYQDWRHPVYDQLYGEFLSHMSVIDVLMNIGPQKTRELIVEK